MNKWKKTFNSIILTIILGVYFSILQGIEYWQAEFCISESIYGSIFFIATGFHGIHVIIGSSFLLTCAIRIKNLEINKNHLIGFEAAAWYWHFVDVVWIFLYRAVYWWGA
jgi:cytochrome c oxidase subunit 3